MNYQDMSKEELLIEIEKLKKQKKYGLVWEQHNEGLNFNTIPLLKEVKEKEINLVPNQKHNLLIEGDNYYALKSLQYTHKGLIDVIYIDPPYNTGNKDFVYNDSFVDNEDGFRHSKWLSFMEKRLKLAKELLSEEGVIFISIDENEQAELKLLCNEIFGYKNHLNTIAIELTLVQGMKVSSAKKGNFVKGFEYIYVYAKNKLNLANKELCPLYDNASKVYDSHFSNVLNENGDIIPISKYINEHDQLKSYFVKYNLSVNTESINLLLEMDKGFENLFMEELVQKLYRKNNFDVAKFTKNIDIYKVNEIYQEDGYTFTKNRNGKLEQLQAYIETFNQSNDFDSKFTRCIFRGTLWKGFYKDMMNVNLEGHIDFKNGKKPLRLLKNILHWYNKKDALVLDFFAGSGTTGHAVMELNKEDGGNRQFILCTNNEVSEDKAIQKLIELGKISNKKEFKSYKDTNDYQEFIQSNDYLEMGIARQVTYQRLSKVINGYTTPKGTYVVGIENNLKYYIVDGESLDINVINTDKFNKLAIDSLLLKYNGTDLISSNEYYSIYNTISNKDLVLLHNVIYVDELLEELDKSKECKFILFTEDYKSYEMTKIQIEEEEYKNSEFHQLPKELLDLYKRISKK